MGRKSTWVPKFESGKPFVSQEVRKKLSPEEIDEVIIRHTAGDWGVSTEEMIRCNEVALQCNGDVFSIHETRAGRLWITTLAGGYGTVVMLERQVLDGGKTVIRRLEGSRLGCGLVS